MSVAWCVVSIIGDAWSVTVDGFVDAVEAPIQLVFQEYGGSVSIQSDIIPASSSSRDAVDDDSHDDITESKSFYILPHLRI